jgi:hypothetical protein
MTTFDVTDRVDPGTSSDEPTMLREWLAYHRGTLAWKCGGLTDEQLRTASIPPSTLTLLGLLRHLTDVERWWVREVFEGTEDVAGYSSDEHPDGDFDLITDTPVDEVWARWRREHAHLDRILQTQPSLDTLSAITTRHGEQPSLRWILLHLIEEYARHNGHADLLREQIDGLTGE